MGVSYHCGWFLDITFHQTKYVFSVVSRGETRKINVRGDKNLTHTKKKGWKEKSQSDKIEMQKVKFLYMKLKGCKI